MSRGSMTWLWRIACAALVLGVPPFARADDPRPSAPGVAPAAASCPTDVIPASRSPGIVAIDRMDDLADTLRDLRCRYGAEAVLVAFDLDNTLLAKEADLGSDAWYVWQEALLKKPSPHKQDLTFEDLGVPEDLRLIPDPGAGGTAVAQDLAGLLRIQGALYQAGPMRLTQPVVRDVVERIQGRGFPTLVVTSRGPAFRGPTMRELARNGLDFTSSAPGCPEDVPPCAFSWRSADLARTFSEKERPCLGDPSRLTGERVLYERGVYMTAGQHKGAMLRLLLSRLQTRVSAVVFVDDTWKHLDRVRTAFAFQPVEVHAFYFRGEHRRVRGFVGADGAASRAAATTAWEALKASPAYPDLLDAVDCGVAPVCCPTCR